MRRRIGLFLAVLLIVFIVVAGCGSGGGSSSSPTTYSIAGAVTSSGAGFQGVTITLSGAGSATATTDASGTFSFANLANGSYTVTPRKTGYTFSPTSSAQTVNSANVTGITFTAAANPSDTTSGLVVYSTYDNSSYSDLTGLGNNLTFEGTQTYTSGRTTGAISLDGLTNRILIADNTYTDINAFQNGYTIAAWIYFTSMPASGESVIVSKGNSGFSLNLTNSGGIRWYHNPGTGLGMSGISGVLVANQWQHVAITWDKVTGTDVLYYNNNILWVGGGYYALSSSSAGALSIGADASFAGSYFKGYIDSVRIYTRALTSDDINALYGMAQ